jgi:hypothetical protein
MKYCIGCQHLWFTPPESGHRYSSMTYDPSIDAKLVCRKGHWEQCLDDYTGILDIEGAMEQADKCPDYVERVTE